MKDSKINDKDVEKFDALERDGDEVHVRISKDLKERTENAVLTIFVSRLQVANRLKLSVMFLDEITEEFDGEYPKEVVVMYFGEVMESFDVKSSIKKGAGVFKKTGLCKKHNHN